MKRSWLSITIMAAVLGLLTLFLGLQYKWLTEVSEAERERLKKRVESDVARLAEDFNREMQAAYYNFQIDGETWTKRDWNEFNERYEFWKQRTAYPELIRAIYFVDKQTAEGQPLKYEPERHAFEPTASPPELNALRTRFSEDNNFVPFYGDAFAMILPIYRGERRVDHVILKRTAGSVAREIRLPDKFGWLVIMLDETTLTGRLLPELTAKYFPEAEYRIAVVDKDEKTIFSTAGATQVADASSPLFNLSPENLMFFSTDALPRMIDEQHKRGVIANQRVESHSFTRTETITGKTGTFQLQLKEPGNTAKPRTTMMASTTVPGSEPWTLRAQHVAGSVDAFVAGERNKSFTIGLAIYVLLVAGILAIVLSAMRSRRFAQRQIDFVSSVSHEFRTPLAVIYSAGENLADGVAKEYRQVARYGELIKGEGKKLSGMVEQILEFAGANSGRQKYSFALVDVADVVNDALSECRPLIESRGFDVETAVQRDLPPISADMAALSSAIQNLIANSVKYSNGKPWIKVSATNGNGRVKIAVEDNGIGIGRAELRQIFEPFYRAKEVVDAQISGNGLGLNLVRNIVEAHGGKVSVESSQGVGSTFTIELPQN